MKKRILLRDQLEKLRACPESLEWIKNKSLEEAWTTCKNTQWMLWFLAKTDLDLINPICDMAERVLHLVPEDCQAVCRRAISAARSRAKRDELNAASDAAYADATDAADAVHTADTAYACADSISTDAAAYYATTSSIYAAANAANYSATLIVNYAVRTATSARSAAADAGDDYFATEKEEQKKQCDILRKYITIEQVREALNKLVS
jgi:hypothetical protein